MEKIKYVLSNEIQKNLCHYFRNTSATIIYTVGMLKRIQIVILYLALIYNI